MYPYQVPAQPKSGNIVTPLLIGCGSFFVIVLVLGGIASYFAWHAIGTAVRSAGDVAEVAKNVERSVRESKAQSGSAQGPEQTTQAGSAALKSLVRGGKPQIATLSRGDLKAFLPPTVGSLERSNAEATSGSLAGISGTSASATYGGSGNGSITIKIIDAANASGLTAMANLTMNAEIENDEGYEKNVDLAGTRVHEKWKTSSKDGEIMTIVGDRFLIEVSSYGAELSQVEKAFESIDVPKLDSIAAKTAQR